MEWGEKILTVKLNTKSAVLIFIALILVLALLPVGSSAGGPPIFDGKVVQTQGDMTVQSVSLRAVIGKMASKGDGTITVLFNPPFSTDDVIVTSSPVYSPGPAAFTTVCGVNRFGACIWIGQWDGIGLGGREISFHAIGPN